MVHLSLGIHISFLQGTSEPLHHSESSPVWVPWIGLKAIPWVPPVRIYQSSVHGTLLNISLAENPARVILPLDELISIQCFGRCEIKLDASLSFLWEDVINHKRFPSLTKAIHTIMTFPSLTYIPSGIIILCSVSTESIYHDPKEF